jgi:hypothetical protein
LIIISDVPLSPLPWHVAFATPSLAAGPELGWPLAAPPPPVAALAAGGVSVAPELFAQPVTTRTTIAIPANQRPKLPCLMSARSSS